MKKYKMYAHSDFAIDIVSKDMDKTYFPVPDFIPNHQILFEGIMVKSGSNKNMAYFDQVELVNGYDSIRYNAIDIEHEQEVNCGAVLDHCFVDSSTGKSFDIEKLREMSDEQLRLKDIDSVIQAVFWEDRYPVFGSVIQNRLASLSMEVYFSNFNIRLENGVLLTIDEANSLGMGEFVDRMMGIFKTKEEFINAHSLNVTYANGSNQIMKVYKYLLDLEFSGAALTQTPACEDCKLISTSRDECDCDDLKAAASVQVPKVEIYSLDLRKVESYMKKERDNKNIPAINHQVPKEVAEDVNIIGPSSTPSNAPGNPPHPVAPPVMLPPSNTTITELDQTAMQAPCPSYRMEEDMKCLYNEGVCETAGNRQTHACFRWLLNDDGSWSFDSRDHPESPNKVVDDTLMEHIVKVDTSGADDNASMNKTTKENNRFEAKLEAAVLRLEVFIAEREASREQEVAAVWTTKFINSLPDSSFAVVESCKDSNKNARHLPFKGSDGKIDLPHLRNALARANQIKSVCGNDSEALRAKAQRKLAPYAKKYLKSDKGD